MKTPVERAIEIAANGNADADAYLRIIARAARMLDDIEDGDNPPVDTGLLAHLLLVALPANPFFCRHAATLISLQDMAINAWQDANQIPADDTHGIFWADLVNEISCVVAGLTGGYVYRRKVSLEIRNLLYERSEDNGLPAGASRLSDPVTMEK